MNQLTTLLVGFLLTSVLGGALGVLFQRRTWEHQHRVQVAVLERQHAFEVFEEISRLLDRRVHRLRLLNWRLRAQADGEPHADLDSTLQDDRDAVREWNENVNRNLALLARYFGVAVREQFDDEIGGRLVRLGQLVEDAWRRGQAPPEPAPPIAHEDLDARIDAVADAVYDFNLTLLETIGGEAGHRR